MSSVLVRTANSSYMRDVREIAYLKKRSEHLNCVSCIFVKKCIHVLLFTLHTFIRVFQPVCLIWSVWNHAYHLIVLRPSFNSIIRNNLFIIGASLFWIVLFCVVTVLVKRATRLERIQHGKFSTHWYASVWLKSVALRFRWIWGVLLCVGYSTLEKWLNLV